MKKLVWAELARRELEAAADHYFNLEPGLENRFLDDADSTIDRIKNLLLPGSVTALQPAL